MAAILSFGTRMQTALEHTDTVRPHSFWTVGRKITALFFVAVIGGFAVMMALQATLQRQSAERLAENDAQVKTFMMANAARVAFMAIDGAAIEQELLPLANSNDIDIASIKAITSTDTLVDYSNPRFEKVDLSTDKDMADAVLAGKGVQSRTLGSHLVIAMPVVTGKSNRLIGVLQIAWSLDRQLSAIWEQMSKLAGICLIALVIQILLLNGVFGRMVLKPLRNGIAAMRRLTQGDTEITVSGTARSDEIGEMAGAIMVFRDNAVAIRRMHADQEQQAARAEQEKRAALTALADRFRQRLTGVIGGIVGASSQMAGDADVMAHAVNETAQQSQTVVREAEVIQSNIRTAAAATTQMSSSIGTITQQVEHSAQIAGEAVGHANQTGETVQSLIISADGIGQAVELIHTIARQTNMLALNATIEAARAGEAGKGFAVVALEVKHLAEQTAKATDEISRHVSSIQAATRNTVSAIDAIGGTIGTIDGVTGEIAHSVQEQNAATREISQAVEGTVTAAQGISHMMDNLARTATDAGGTASGVQSAARKLSEQAHRLEAEVASFLDEIRSQAAMA